MKLNISGQGFYTIEIFLSVNNSIISLLLIRMIINKLNVAGCKRIENVSF